MQKTTVLDLAFEKFSVKIISEREIPNTVLFAIASRLSYLATASNTYDSIWAFGHQQALCRHVSLECPSLLSFFIFF